MRLSLLLSLCISEKKVDGPGCNVAFEICWLRIRVTRIHHIYILLRKRLPLCLKLSLIYFSTTRFRWIQDTQSSVGVSWALDDIYVGESCPELCHSRGTCLNGKCFCERGYYGSYQGFQIFYNAFEPYAMKQNSLSLRTILEYIRLILVCAVLRIIFLYAIITTMKTFFFTVFVGKKCLPQPGSLIRTMYDSFEGGIFSFYWESVSGGGIGFGCGALRPFAHGKTLYFNGCGHREARTVEMDLRNAK